MEECCPAFPVRLLHPIGAGDVRDAERCRRVRAQHPSRPHHGGARTLLDKGTTINATAKSLKIGIATVHRIKMAQAA
ncbi:helix-turn-helix domain-containing protein [Sphingomonas sanguinis]|nr:helix-turn-helix domain-containing protein [Sphingomonas sanguinis]